MLSEEDAIHRLNQTVRLLNKKSNEALHEFGLYSSQWAVLYCLDRKGRLSQTEICRYLNVERPTITRTIRKLEENGWVEREKGKDRRENLISLSEEAEKKLPAVNSRIRTFEEEQLGDLTAEEVLSLNRILKKIMKEV